MSNPIYTENQVKLTMNQIVREQMKQMAEAKEEETQECGRCGQDVKPSEHPEIGCDR